MRVIYDGFGHIIASARNSVRGVVTTFNHELAFRQEVVLICPHFVLLYIGHFCLLAWLTLTILLALIFIVELINTAIECIVDLASPDYNELAKRAKDAASAAVFVCLVLYGLVWSYFIFWKLLAGN